MMKGANKMMTPADEGILAAKVDSIMNNIVEQVTAKLDEMGFPVSYELPGCVMIHSNSHFYGTCNDFWGGNTEDGMHSWELDIPSTCRDAGEIARAIASRELLFKSLKTLEAILEQWDEKNLEPDFFQLPFELTEQVAELRRMIG